MLNGNLVLNDSFIQYIKGTYQFALSVKEFSRMTNLDNNAILKIVHKNHNNMVSSYENSIYTSLDNESIPIFLNEHELIPNSQYKYFIDTAGKVFIKGISSKKYYVIDEYLLVDSFSNLIKTIYRQIWSLYTDDGHYLQDIPTSFVLNKDEYENSFIFLDKLFLYKYLFRRIYFHLAYFREQFLNDVFLDIPDSLDKLVKQTLTNLCMEVRKMITTDKTKFEFMKKIDETFEKIYQPYIVMDELLEEEDKWDGTFIPG